jgi:hypothetical protein
MADADSSGLDFDSDQFLMPRGLWFVGPKKYPRGDLVFLCTSLAKVQNRDGIFVAAFTDEDLAWRFVGRMAEKELLEPFRPADPEALTVLLKGLLTFGHAHLAIDPEKTSDQRTSIRVLIEALASGA